MTWLPTVKVPKRAITKASPRAPAVTIPSLFARTDGSLFDLKTAKGVMSRSVPSE